MRSTGMILAMDGVENVDIYERLTRIENPEDIKYLIGIVC